MKTPSTSNAIESLEPAPVWRLFASLTAVPRPSKREERVREHVKSIAEQNGLEAREDHAGNLLIEAPASPGCEAAPITVLQGHLDMVCEKNAATTHNFESEPIRALLDTDPDGQQPIVRADGTTLGADNGIGVALALAAAWAPDVVHGPLELLFTVDEEAGMSGAKALAPDFLRGRRMLNLDSEEDDTIYIGCAGGCDTTLTWSLATQPSAADADVCRVAVKGLCGGHSGGDIHKNRGNAIKLVTRILLAAESDRLQLAGLHGGSLRNVIPREAVAVVTGPAGTLASLERAAADLREQAARESVEDNPSIRVERLPLAEGTVVLSVGDTRKMIQVLAALPHGVLGMHPAIDGLVQSSNNLATVATRLNESASTIEVGVGTLARSSSASSMQVVLQQIAAVGRLTGGEVTLANDYPGWEPDMKSGLLATCGEVYEQLFGVAAKVTAIHAGLECGIIGERVGGMDMVSFGPRITGAHSPDERVYVTSVQKVWMYLRAVLAELAKR